MKHLFLMLPALLFLFACKEDSKQGSRSLSTAPAQKVNLSDSFNNYWYSGKAELTTYQLEQVRYGDIHTGHATFIFVSEPFSKSQQVKLDNADAHPEDAINVLKLNFTRKFNTGIYPYSTMLSTFKPIEEADEHSLKATFSAQEWCGQSFFQLNRSGENDYDYQGFSYFENEGDVEGSLENVILEDEIWNTLRISPDLLPSGDIRIFPSLTFIRLRHQPIRAYEAEAQLKKMENGKMNYTIDYKKVPRKLSITFDGDFPYIIRSWEEEMRSGFGEDAKVMTTRATFMKQMRSAYWQQNQKNDRYLRTQLNLPENYQ